MKPWVYSVILGKVVHLSALFPSRLSYPSEQSQGTAPYRAGRAAPMVFVQCLCL